MVSNQDLPLVLSPKVHGLIHLGHVLPHELESYHIFSHLLQVGGYLGWALGWS